MILSNKSAKLVPKKNMLNPKAWVAGRIFDTAFKPLVGLKVNGNNVTIQSTVNAMVSQVVEVKPNTSYTAFHGSDANGRGVYVYSISGTDLTPANKLSPNTFNSGSNTKVIIGLYKSTSVNNLSEIEIVNPMMVEGSTQVPFEDYKGLNKIAKGTPTKNLIPNFNDKGWFQDSTLAGGVMNVNPTDPHKMQLVISQSAQARLIHIPVQIGKSYTFNFGKITGLYRIYKSKVTFHDAPKALIQDSVPAPFTFTVDASYNGYVTIRVTQGYTGTFSFENLQLVEGWWNIATFEPYKEVLKKAKLVPKKNLVPKLSDSWIRNGSVAELAYSDDYILEINPTGTYRYVAYKNIPVVAGKTYMVSGEIENNTSTSAIRVFKTSDLSSGNIVARNGQSFTVDSSYTGVVSVVLSNGEQLTKTKIKNFQLEEGSTATPFTPYELSAKKSKSTIVKAPHRNYPFKFKRENVEIFEGVQYGINVPRIKNGGILLEEYTFNLLSGKTFLPNNPTTIVDKGDSYLVTAGSTSNFQGAYLTNVTVKAVTTYTLSAKVEELGSALGKLDFVIEQTGGTTIRKKPVKFGDRYYITFTTGSGVTRISTCFYLGGGVIGDAFTLGKDVQLEERPYPTSPANSVRKADDLQIPVTFDKLGGSFEMEFDYHYSEGATQYLFDTNPEERWLIYKETYNSWIVYTGGVSRGYISKNPVEGRNKIKLSWTATDFEIILNGEKVAGKAHSLTGLQSNIFLGQRYTVGSHLDDVIYSAVIKDHNGNIQFQI